MRHFHAPINGWAIATPIYDDNKSISFGGLIQEQV